MVQLEIKPTAIMRFRVFAIIWLAVCFSAVLVYLLTGGRGELFAARTTISTYLPDATGVTESTEVRLSGIQIGNVSHVQLSGRLDPQHAVFIGMTIKKRYLRNIPLDSTTAIGANTLIGDKFIDINEGKSTAPLNEGGILESEPVKQASDRADLIRSLADDLRQIDSMLATVSDPNSRLGHFIVGEEEYDNLLIRVKEVDAAIRGFVSPTSPLGQMLFSDTLYTNLHRDVINFDQTLSSLQRGEGTAGQLLSSDQQYEDFLRKARGLRDSLAKLSAGQGSAGSLLVSDAGYEKLNRALKSMDITIAKLNAGEGQMGDLLRSPQLYESLNGSLHDLDEMLRDFREHPEKYLRYQVFGKKKPRKAVTK
jgi:phospholipid/cholesterol/gamma-HCH transport system substrate-binding protein